MAEILRSLLESLAAAYSIAVSSIQDVLDAPKGYYTLLVPANEQDDRRARITAMSSKSEGVSVSVNVAPDRTEGKGSKRVVTSYLGPRTAENAAKAVVMCNDWDSLAQSAGFAVKGIGALVDGPNVLWVRRGSKGRGRGKGTTGVPAFGKVVEPVVDSKPEPVVDSKPEPVVDVIAGMSSKPEPVVDSKPEPVVDSKPEPELVSASGVRLNRGRK